MWIQLLTHRRFPDKSGKLQFHFPGEVVNVKNKALCWELIQNGHALNMSLSSDDVPEGVGVVVRGREVPGWAQALTDDVVSGEFGVPYPLTVILDPAVRPNHRDLRIALAQLGKRYWDVAVPLLDYARTAAHVGTRAERERTAKVLPTLLCPVYDTRLILAKMTDRTTKLMNIFAEECEGAKNYDLAFLRACYRVKPYLWALQQEIIARGR